MRWLVVLTALLVGGCLGHGPKAPLASAEDATDARLATHLPDVPVDAVFNSTADGCVAVAPTAPTADCQGFLTGPDIVNVPVHASLSGFDFTVHLTGFATGTAVELTVRSAENGGCEPPCPVPKAILAKAVVVAPDNWSVGNLSSDPVEYLQVLVRPAVQANESVHLDALQTIHVEGSLRLHDLQS